MLSPASRGALLTASIISYEFMGLVGGYYAGRLYKSMKGKEWKRAAFLTGKVNLSYRSCAKFINKSFFTHFLNSLASISSIVCSIIYHYFWKRRIHSKFQKCGPGSVFKFLLGYCNDALRDPTHM